MTNIATSIRPAVWYAAFDKQTGHILHTHSRLSAETNEHVEVPEEDLRALLLKDPSLVASLTDQDPANLDILRVGPQDSIPGPGTAMSVDVANRRIVPKPRLVLKADKREVVGDGFDSTIIEIRAVDEHGHRVHTVNDRIKVTTTRGKLSERGGLVALDEGRASIILTSVAETVDHVRVGATSLTGACAGGDLTLEFV
jgi:hypothetical protein